MNSCTEETLSWCQDTWILILASFGSGCVTLIKTHGPYFLLLRARQSALKTDRWEPAHLGGRSLRKDATEKHKMKVLCVYDEEGSLTEMEDKGKVE